MEGEKKSEDKEYDYRGVWPLATNHNKGPQAGTDHTGHNEGTPRLAVREQRSVQGTCWSEAHAKQLSSLACSRSPKCQLVQARRVDKWQSRCPPQRMLSFVDKVKHTVNG